MNKTLYICILLLIIGCSSSKYQTVFVQHLDSRIEGEKFIDSLVSVGFDTIIGYYDGCSGCISGMSKPYYVFWSSSKYWNLTKITTYSRYENIRGYTPPVNYLTAELSAIENKNLKEPDFFLSHYPYEVVRIHYQGKTIKYEFTADEKLVNESSAKVILVDKIRSKLLDIYPNEWKVIDYKTKKVKTVPNKK